MRRAVLSGLVLALTLAALAPAALSDTGRHGRLHVKARQPAGQLQLAGTGAITLSGQLTAFGSIPDGGSSLVAQDQGRGGITVTINGVRQPVIRGLVRVNRAQGSFYVQGSNVRVRIQGTNLSLSAAGRGRVAVAGVGQWRKNGADPLDWPPGYAQIDLLPPVS